MTYEFQALLYGGKTYTIVASSDAEAMTLAQKALGILSVASVKKIEHEPKEKIMNIHEPQVTIPRHEYETLMQRNDELYSDLISTRAKLFMLENLIEQLSQHQQMPELPYQLK